MSDLSRSTRSLLDRGRTPEPLDAARRARLKKSVMARVGAASALAAATTWWSPAAAKIVTSAVLVVGLGGAGVAWKLGAFDPPEPAASAGPVAPAHPQAQAFLAAATGAAPVATAVRSEPDRVVTAAPTGAPAPAPTAMTETASAPAPAVVVAKSSPPTTTRAEPAPVPSPVSPRTPDLPATNPPPAATPASPSPGSQQSPAPAGTATGPTAPASLGAGAGDPPSARSSGPAVSALEEEARLVREADQALQAGDAARALTLLDEHAARFPSGVLAPERAAGRVFALCQAGRVDEARAEGARFLATHDRGPLSARVQSSCAGSAPPR